MDRDLAHQILEAYGRPVIQTGGKTISFSRQSSDNIREIEALSDEELISKWKSLVFVNLIYGQVSLNDMQRIDLMDLEIHSRFDEETKNELNKWVEDSSANFDESLSESESGETSCGYDCNDECDGRCLPF